MKEEDCTHDSYHKDYINGMHTGDYICDRCGKEFTSRDAADAASEAAHARLAAKVKNATFEQP